jgi:ribonuclease HI
MRFKDQQVWVRADDAGKPILDSTGRAEMKYRESDAKSYRPSLANLGAVTSGDPVLDALPAPARRVAAGPKPAASGGPAIEIWTDGACSGNPGPMGIGVVVLDGGKRKEHGEYLGIGTNNIAELVAVERGLELAVKLGAAAGSDESKADGEKERRMRVYTDSSYSIGVLSKGWKAKANQELIARLRKRLAALPVEFVKVAGHAGVPENERCDELARAAITRRT